MICLLIQDASTRISLSIQMALSAVVCAFVDFSNATSSRLVIFDEILVMAMYGTNALIGSTGVYIWQNLFRANENESKTGLVRLLGVKQNKNKNICNRRDSLVPHECFLSTIVPYQPLGSAWLGLSCWILDQERALNVKNHPRSMGFSKGPRRNDMSLDSHQTIPVLIMDLFSQLSLSWNLLISWTGFVA